MTTQRIEHLTYKAFDIEVFPNLFVIVIGSTALIKYHDTNYYEYTLSTKTLRPINRTSFASFINLYLISTGVMLVGYNSQDYDDEVLEFIRSNNYYVTNYDIYSFSKLLVDNETKFDLVKQFQKSKESVDVYKILHYNNKARATSLKWLEFYFRLPNVLELPYKPNHIVLEDEIEEIIEYCFNDVYATGKAFQYVVNTDELKVRKEVSALLKKDVTNYSNVKIGSEINKKVYLELSKKYKVPEPIERKFIKLSDCVPKYISFKTKELINILEDIKSKTVYHTKGALNYDITLGNLVLHLKQGGLHSKDSPGIFETTTGSTIRDIDVGSMYPTAIINNGYYPQHLGKEWLIGYEQTRDTRITYKHQGKKALANAYKLALNGGGFGKTNDEFDWQYDPLVTMQTTITCQLALLMLIEEYYLNSFKILSVNTDGITLDVLNEKTEEFRNIYKSWETKVMLEMEEAVYKKYVRRDINNYIALTDDNKFKMKGCFDINPEPHKNHSMLIVPIALKKYFFENIPVSETIKNHDNIFDFCKAIKIKRNQKAEIRTWENGEYEIEEIDRIIRYYISNSKSKLYKVLPPLEKQQKETNQMSIFDIVDDVVKSSDRVHEVEVGWNITNFNEYSDNYDINYNYYINECLKIINPINNGQI